MKTRIKEIKYGDGICNYKVQTIRNYNSINKKIDDSFEENPLLFLAFFYIFVLIHIALCFVYMTEYEFESLDKAKAKIDDIYREIEVEKKAKLKEKLAEKVVSKKYIKYP